MKSTLSASCRRSVVAFSWVMLVAGLLSAPAAVSMAGVNASAAELAPVISTVLAKGIDNPLPGRFAYLLGLSNGSDVPMQAIIIKDQSVAETKAAGVIVDGNVTFLVLLDHFPGRMTLYLTSADGRMLKGYLLSAAAPQPVDVNYPDFELQKVYWKNQAASAAAAPNDAGR